MKVTLYVNQSLEENAARYFDKAKKIAKKIEGAKASLLEHQEKLATLEKKRTHELAVREEALAHKNRKKEWYEKFRWFFSSEGFLVIGGRDATSNEVVIKKHTESNDLVFHTDMAGSPFFVVKSQGKEIGDATKKEVANATCTFSRAWKLGLSTSPVFMAKPEQVSKQAQTGEYMGKGAFMIYGKVEYVENTIDLAIGVNANGLLMSGPLASVKKHCSKFLELAQGDEKASDIAKLIKAKLGGTPDDIIRALPSGEFRVKK